MYEIKTKIMQPDEVVSLSDVASIYPSGSVKIESNGNCVVLLLYTDNGGEVTIEAGDSVFAGAPLTFTMSPAIYYAVQLETGRYMNQSGENKGKIILSTSVEDLTCNCFQVN